MISAGDIRNGITFEMEVYNNVFPVFTIPWPLPVYDTGSCDSLVSLYSADGAYCANESYCANTRKSIEIDKRIFLTMTIFVKLLKFRNASV